MTIIPTPKYLPPPPIELPDRRWPGRSITQSPIWCSVDLRDGNQALPNPLSPARKLEYFDLLCRMGFKHIEISFPSASQDDFDFTRRLIEQKLIPDDVFIMVLTQARDHLIERTFEALKGVPRAIFHVYCASSDLHTRQVFGLSRTATKDMVVQSVQHIRALAVDHPAMDLRLEFSPEEFTDTDLSFALELCEAAFASWGRATAEKPMILNLPATVERRPPNQYADMIEWFCRHFSHPDQVIVSAHTHNDQGMAVAATEMALLAGAQRVEGALFGHGERTGNVDLVVLANNLHSRGIDTGLDFSNLPEVADTVERLTGMSIYYRQPYAGEYVFTAFSGSHQDAIRKGMNKLDEAPDKFGVGWKVPYLHIDPTDVGRRYESLIRINSQSGKGGVAYVLEADHGLRLPRGLQVEFSRAVQAQTDATEEELGSKTLIDLFEREYLDRNGRFELIDHADSPVSGGRLEVRAKLRVDGRPRRVRGEGTGPIDAFVAALRRGCKIDAHVLDYSEHALGDGEDAVAIAYVQVRDGVGHTTWGVGRRRSIVGASLDAVVSALNRLMQGRPLPVDADRA